VKGPNWPGYAGPVEDGKVLFVAKAPSVGFAVYTWLTASAPAYQFVVKVTANSLENARYKVQLNVAGDVSSVFDKNLKKEFAVRSDSHGLSRTTLRSSGGVEHGLATRSRRAGCALSVWRGEQDSHLREDCSGRALCCVVRSAIEGGGPAASPRWDQSSWMTITLRCEGG